MEKFEGNNSAVLKELKLIALDSITYIPNQQSFNYDDMTLEEETDFTTIEFTHLTAGWRKSDNEGKGGNYFKNEVFCSIPCVRNEIFEELKNLRSRPLAALVTEINGESRLIYPLKMLIKVDVPGTASGWNGFDLLLSGESKNFVKTVIFSSDSSDEGI